jgi:mono/diheme cytochrome c family protein
MAAVVNAITSLMRAAVAAQRRRTRESGMHEGLKGRPVVTAIAAVVAVALLGPLAAGGQGAWEAPAAEKARKNPLPPGAEALAKGKQVVQLNCVACHGSGGKGDGAAAQALNPKPADWTSPAVQAEPDGELFWKISNGRGAMPPWKHLPEAERWAMVHYIRSLKAK